MLPTVRVIFQPIDKKNLLEITAYESVTLCQANQRPTGLQISEFWYLLTFVYADRVVLLRELRWPDAPILEGDFNYGLARCHGSL